MLRLGRKDGLIALDDWILDFIARFLLALYAMRKVNLSILATAFSGHAKEESNYKRLQRFVREFEMPYAQLALFIVKLLGGCFLGRASIVLWSSLKPAKCGAWNST
jgi:hypothetical protein